MTVLSEPIATPSMALTAPNRVPSATYRVQLNQAFTFEQASAIVAYLESLGISDLYTSPFFRASAESTHGYDIADHNSLNPALGGEEGFARLAQQLRERGMGLLLDTVPNHMGIGEASNTWWMDVLENGPSSIYAPFFDIDWQPTKRELENKVLLPILGEQYGWVLEAGELRVQFADGAFDLFYYEHALPVNPRSYPMLLELKLPNLLEQLAADDEGLLEYQSILTGLNNLPPRSETDQHKVAERHREKEILKRRLDTLYRSAQPVQAAIDAALTQINGVAGDARSFDLLDQLIDRQAYRLAYWRVAAEQINYRRFFDINDLAAIRMEREDVFQATHRLLLRLIGEGSVTGVRLDHIDGLYDPAAYFQRLQRAYAEGGAQGTGDTETRRHGDSESGTISANSLALQRRESPSLYLLAEKILARGEPLPESWAIHGTTGYDFTNALNGVFVDSTAERRFNEMYSDFIDRRIDFEQLTYETRRQIMRLSLASELTVLAFQLSQIAERNRYYRDFTFSSLRDTLREVIAHFPVYRSYIAADCVSERDQQVIEQAVARARRHNAAAEQTVYDFLRDVLLLRYPGTSDDEAREAQRQFVMKFQQLTGPVMAKGLEDTAFYIYNRLVSLNEVGSEPRFFGSTIAAFHRQNQERLQHWPYAMLASSTHDTKRSEDVRARINVLSELPGDWRTLLTRASRRNHSRKAEIDGRRAPDRNEEYLFYQVVLGTLPLEPLNAADQQAYVARIQDYMIKAIREAKVNTSWLNPNNDYDQAVVTFVAAALNDTRFLAQLDPLLRTVAHFGVYNSLAQTLLKLTAPGVPDIYQGNDMFDFSLVDPDNRRPVDYQLRAYLLHELQTLPMPQAELARQLSDSRDSRSKLWLTWKVLNLRRNHVQLFQDGNYTPLAAGGEAADHIIAFSRSNAETTLISVAPRLLAKKLGEPLLPLGAAAWGADMLVLPDASAGQSYRNLLTGEEIVTVEIENTVGLALAEVLANFPVALLERG